MRALARNKQTFYYALYQGHENITDSDGYLTGEKEVLYGEPTEYKANISPARGSADIELFGITEQYTKTIVTTDMDCPIDEMSRLWIEKNPHEGLADKDGVGLRDKFGRRLCASDAGILPHDYVVVRVARSINSITIAIKEVSAS
jgi:hypothetical protein